MSNNFDEYAFHRQIAHYNSALAVILTAGGILAAAGIAFVTTGVTEINHSPDAQGEESQNRMLTFGFKFVESGVEDLMIGLLIIIISGSAFFYLIRRIRSPVQPRIDRLENVQQSDQFVSSEINQQEEKLKNLKILTEIENLKVELASLKLEAAALKLEQNNTNNPKAKRIDKKHNQK